MSTTAQVKSYGFQKPRMLAMMQERDLGVVLITSPENVFYTTGLPCLPVSGQPMIYNLRNRLPFFSLIDCEGRTTLLCWGYAAEGISLDADDVVGFKNREEAVECLKSLLRDKLSKCWSLGVESSCPYYVLDVIKETAHPENSVLVVVDDLMARLRLIKSKKEIALVTQATQIVQKTLRDLYDVMSVGMSRLELLREARYRMFKYGATGISHLTCAFGGTNPEVAIDETLDEHKLVTLDLGAICDGYASDNRRYVYTGAVPDAILERHGKTVEIVDTLGAALVAGNKFSKIHQLASELCAKEDIQLAYDHVGHSIGLETEELRLTAETDIRIEQGMIVNIELFSKLETGQSIGDEETYVIDKTGPTRITSLSREIRSIS